MENPATALRAKAFAMAAALAVALAAPAWADSRDDIYRGITLRHGRELIRLLNRALSDPNLRPDDRVEAYDGRAHAHFELGQYDLAIADAQAALAIDPKNGWAKRLLDDAHAGLKWPGPPEPKRSPSLDVQTGIRLLDDNQFSQAIVYFDVALDNGDITPADRVAALGARAQSYQTIGEKGFALEDAKAALVLDSANPRALIVMRHYGWITADNDVQAASKLGAAGDLPGALALFNQALANRYIDPDVRVTALAQRAEVQFRLNHMDLALADARSAIALDPNDKTAREAMALVTGASPAAAKP